MRGAGGPDDAQDTAASSAMGNTEDGDRSRALKITATVRSLVQVPCRNEGPNEPESTARKIRQCSAQLLSGAADTHGVAQFVLQVLSDFLAQAIFQLAHTFAADPKSMRDLH